MNAGRVAAPEKQDDMPSRQRGLALFAKRAVDCAVAGTALVATAPLLAASAAAVRVTMGSPVLFRQQRPGRGGAPFEVWKLRTMLAQPKTGAPLSDAVRLTRLGRFLRASSLDELPQLVNVLRGDMSLVGPRPLLMQYLGRYSDEQARRHDVLPGITGLAQVRGRNALTWPEKFALDLQYVDEWSLALDAKILLETVARVIVPQGVAHGGEATMPEFMGNEPA